MGSVCSTNKVSAIEGNNTHKPFEELVALINEASVNINNYNPKTISKLADILTDHAFADTNPSPRAALILMNKVLITLLNAINDRKSTVRSHAWRGLNHLVKKNKLNHLNGLTNDLLNELINTLSNEAFISEKCAGSNMNYTDRFFAFSCIHKLMEKTVIDKDIKEKFFALFLGNISNDTTSEITITIIKSLNLLVETHTFHESNLNKLLLTLLPLTQSPEEDIKNSSLSIINYLMEHNIIPMSNLDTLTNKATSSAETTSTQSAFCICDSSCNKNPLISIPEEILTMENSSQADITSPYNENALLGLYR